MLKHIVYLHGFNSSPKSTKAQQFVRLLGQSYAHVTVHVPHLSTWPRQAMEQVSDLVEELQQEQEPGDKIAFVGSSLGGFYATWLAQQFAAKAVLINPAVWPHRLLQDALGPQYNYHQPEHEYELTAEHLAQWRTLAVTSIKQPQNLLVLLQMADETLDYKQAVQYYADSHLDIAQGGSHAYDDFPQRIPQMMAFLG